MARLPISVSDPKKGGCHFSVSILSLFPGSDAIARTTRGANPTADMQSAWARIEPLLAQALPQGAELSISIGQPLVEASVVIVAATVHGGDDSKTIFQGNPGGFEAFIASGQLVNAIEAQNTVNPAGQIGPIQHHF